MLLVLTWNFAFISLSHTLLPLLSSISPPIALSSTFLSHPIYTFSLPFLISPTPPHSFLFFHFPCPLLIQFLIVSVKHQTKDGGLPVLPPKWHRYLFTWLWRGLPFAFTAGEDVRPLPVTRRLVRHKSEDVASQALLKSRNQWRCLMDIALWKYISHPADPKKTKHLLSQVWWPGSAAADFPRVCRHLCLAAENLQEADACAAGTGRHSSWTQLWGVPGTQCLCLWLFLVLSRHTLSSTYRCKYVLRC